MPLARGHDSTNPFRSHGTAGGARFTDRADEIARTVASLREPGAKLVVYGPRRMGKSSLLTIALERLARQGVRGFLADLSKASTVADMAFRVLEAAGRSLGKEGKASWRDIAGRLSAVATWAPDPVTGVPVPRFELGLRRAEVPDQHTTLERVLDALEASAAAAKTPVGIVLDEFQEICRFGGERAEWQLRGVVQHHQWVSYVFAGSEEHLIRQMVGPSRAFYGMLDLLHVGPMDPGHLARWLDEMMAAAGVRAAGAGERLVAIAGPRTGDVVHVARACFDIARAGGVAAPDVADRAFLEVVAGQDDALHAWWGSLTPHRQNVLRAVADGGAALTGAEARNRFALSSSSAVAQTLAAFVEQGRLVRTDSPAGYDFDSPFARGWVILNALPDLGIRKDPIVVTPAATRKVTESAVVRYAKRLRRKRGSV